MGNKRERVLVFDALFLKGFTELPGYTSKSCNQILFEEIVHESKFRLRERVENDPQYKQIIPYTVLRNVAREVLVYKRSPKGNESRLHDRWSIGVGGHVNPGDERDGRDHILTVAAWRELEEELKFFPVLEKYEKVITPTALLYLDSTPVNQVHFGVVYTYLCQRDVVRRSEDIAECLWVSPKKLGDYNLEDWSATVASHLD